MANQLKCFRHHRSQTLGEARLRSRKFDCLYRIHFGKFVDGLCQIVLAIHHMLWLLTGNHYRVGLPPFDVYCKDLLPKAKVDDYRSHSLHSWNIGIDLVTYHYIHCQP